MPASFAIASSIINLIANFLLIPRFGINGAALGALLPQAIVVPVFIWKTSRDLQFSLGRVLLEALGRPLACALPQFVLLYVLQGFVHNLFQLMLLCVASLMLFAVLAFLIAASREERDELLSQFVANRIMARFSVSTEPK